VSIDTTTGLLTVASTVAAGTYSFTITASNGTAPDATQSFTLTVNAPLSSDKAITAFSLLGNTGVIDETAGTIAVTVPFDTDVTSLTPVITHTGEGISPTGGQDFSTPVTYTVEAEDGTTKTYTVTVMLDSAPPPPDEDANIDPAGVSSTTFDKNPNNPNNDKITVILSPGSHSLVDIKCDGTTLTEGVDYTIDGDEITFTREFLDSLGVGTHEITFVMSGGANPLITITVADTSKNKYDVLNDFMKFDGTGDRFAKVDVSSSRFLRLEHKGAGVDPTNYKVTEGSTIITFTEAYLKTLANGTYYYVAVFTDGYADLTLVVDVQSTTDPDTGSTTDIPKTGDGGLLWLLLAGCLAVVGTVLIRVGTISRAGRRL